METFNLVPAEIWGSPTEIPALAKVMAFLLVWLGLWLSLAIPLSICLNWRLEPPMEGQKKWPLLASLYFLAPLVVWIATKVEGVPFSSYGLIWKSATLASIALGFGLAAVGLILLFFLQQSFGWINLQLRDRAIAQEKTFTTFWQLFALTLLPTLLLALWIGGTEELIFRGVLQNLLQQDYSSWMAAAISSLIFALLHLVWEIRETVPQIPGLWLMGMVLTLARIGDGGSIGLAWGLHAGWVWGIASIETTGAICYTGKVPDWVTGISAKPLAGVLGNLLLLATGVLLGLGWAAMEL